MPSDDPRAAGGFMSLMTMSPGLAARAHAAVKRERDEALAEAKTLREENERLREERDDALAAFRSVSDRIARIASKLPVVNPKDPDA